ncbi:MAG: DUF4912 domain-containing protein [Spirochaetaceae bacterium]|nr:MAG: DUF4912 domain-containing protein [Spirochaetaceae bacterium]
MTIERLQSLSDDVLEKLAENLEVDWEESEGREELIAMLVEAYADIRREREAANNNPVNVQEKKYDIQEELVAAGDYGEELIDIPDRYNETRITLLLRDPSWAFCYWDINDTYLAELADEHGKAVTGLTLHVVEVACCVDNQDTVVDSFDVPVFIDDLNWYINLPNRDSFYRVRLMLQLEDSEVLLAESNAIQVPSGTLAANGESDPRTDALIALSGMEKLGVFSHGGNMPQRIRSVAERCFLE